MKGFDLTPFSAFTQVTPGEQSFGLIMTADASPKDTWLALLIRLNRISEIFMAWLLKKAVLSTLIMLRESVDLQGLKRYIVKRQTDKIITLSN